MKKKKLSKIKMNKLAKEISKYEGKKKQVSIANIREILRIMFDMGLLKE